MIETGVYFGDVHSFFDLDLILSSVNIPPAKPKTNNIDIPGGDGSIDLTEAHGEVKFKDRDCTFTFTVTPDDAMSFEERKTHVANVLNGLKCKIILDKDDKYYYVGRCTINQYKQDGHLKQITVNAKVEPYKYKIDKTIVTVATTETEKLLLLKNSRKSVVPKITCSTDTEIAYNGIAFTLKKGTHQVLDFALTQPETVISIMSALPGTTTFEYQEGAL